MPSNVRKHQQARVMALTPLEVSAGMARLAGRYRVVVDEDHVTVSPPVNRKSRGVITTLSSNPPMPANTYSLWRAP